MPVVFVRIFRSLRTFPRRVALGYHSFVQFFASYTGLFQRWAALV
jgi:hypothetical protein